MKRTGAEILITLLERQGIRVISGIPGGANLPIYDALGRSTIRHVLARHEQGAGFIAHGMARSTGLPAVCFGTSGPGATNLVTAIADAKLDSVPMVAITGQVPLPLIGTDAFQEIDTFGLTLPVCKHSYLVRSPEELLEVVPAAFRIAMSGRPGPVVIDIPKNVQTAEWEVTEWPEPAISETPPRIRDNQIETLCRLLETAKRPLLIAGGGVIAAEAAPVVRQFAERASLPVALTLMGLGAMPPGHPLCLGMLGMHGMRGTNLAVQECDLLIAAGMRFDDRATGRIDTFCPAATVIHIDIDASEIGKNRRPSLGIVGDVGEVLTRVLTTIPELEHAEWLEEIARLRRSPAPVPDRSDALFTPCGLIRRCSEIVDGHAIVTTDVGQHQMWVAQTYPVTHPRQWLSSGGLGTMGFGLPAAIGAALVHPDRQVLCFTGDGSLLMNVQELATLAEENLNVKIILFDNGVLGLVRQQQDFFYGGRQTASTFTSRIDYVSMAEAFGIPAWNLAGEENADARLRAVLSTPGPGLVRVPINSAENVYPMVPPGAANTTMIDHDDRLVSE